MRRGRFWKYLAAVCVLVSGGFCSCVELPRDEDRDASQGTPTPAEHTYARRNARRSAELDAPAEQRATSMWTLPRNLESDFEFVPDGSAARAMLWFVTEDGVLVATASDTNELILIDGAKGRILETHQMPLMGEDSIYWRPVQDGAGGLCAGGSGSVMSLNRDYSVDWLFELDMPVIGPPGVRPRRETHCSAAATADAVVIAVWPSEQVLCFSRDGAFRWSFRMTAYNEATPPSIDAMGNVYVGDSAGLLYCISPIGDLHWRARAYEGAANGSALLVGAPIVGPDGVIWQGTRHWLAAVSPTGEVMWKYPNHYRGAIRVPPALGLNGELYLGLDEWEEQRGEVEVRWSSHMCCLDPNGNEKWRVDTQPVSAAPCVDGANTVVVGTKEGQVAAISEDGVVLWEVPIARSPILKVLIGPCASLYVQCEDRRIFALRGTATIEQ